MNAMFIGAVSSGKTTLIQRLCDAGIQYQKTQAVDYICTGSRPDCFGNGFIDTPGEYMQVRSFWCSLTTTSCDADMICLIQDSTSEDCWFSGGISSKFAKPVIGIVTKIDDKESDAGLAEAYLRHAGCQEVFHVSAFTNAGVDRLYDEMHHIVEDFREKTRRICTCSDFD